MSNSVGDFPVKGKILVITGGGSGIGLSYARLFHSKGGRVLIGDLKLSGDAEKFVHETETDSPGSVVFARCDVTKWRDLENLISASVAEFGEVPDVYCPCAGIFEPAWSNFFDDTETDGYATIRINTEHPIKLCRLATRALVGADKKGVVLLVSSGSGLFGTYNAALYTASKHAVVGLCRSLGSLDPDEGVKVVCMCPGVVATALWEDRQDDRASQFRYQADGQATMQPEAMAEAMMRLVQDGRYSGGTVLLKMPAKEEVVNEGGPTDLGFDTSHIRAVIAGERGRKWDAM